MSQPAPTVAQDPETATYAHSVTVQIQSDRGHGSGVIIAKKGIHCTAATAGHVVQDKEMNYQDRTASNLDSRLRLTEKSICDRSPLHPANRIHPTTRQRTARYSRKRRNPRPTRGSAVPIIHRIASANLSSEGISYEPKAFGAGAIALSGNAVAKCRNANLYGYGFRRTRLWAGKFKHSLRANCLTLRGITAGIWLGGAAPLGNSATLSRIETTLGACLHSRDGSVYFTPGRAFGIPGRSDCQN